MSLESMLDAARDGTDPVVEEGWGQGRATFGGLVGALAVAALRGRAGADAAPPRTVTLTFVAPLVPGPVRLDSQVLRRGSSVLTCGVDLVQPARDGADQVAATATGAFGAARESSVVVDPPEPVEVLGAGVTGAPIPPVPGLTPPFFDHVALWPPVLGDLPYSGSTHSEVAGWVAAREPTGVGGAELVTLLTDAVPSALMQRLASPAPGSTLSWTLEFFRDPRGCGPGDRLAYHAWVDAARDGYGHTRMYVWDAEGFLVALSTQTVAVFG